MSSNRLQLIDYLEGQGTFGRNFIKNPSGLKNSTRGITASGAVITRNTTTPLTAISDVQIVLDAATDYAEFTTNSLDRSLSGQACEMTADYKLTLGSGATVQAQVLINGVIANSTPLTATTTVNKVSLVYPCGDLSTATTVRFAQTVAATTSTINVANVYLGAAKSIGTVAQAQTLAIATRSTTQAIGSTGFQKVQLNSKTLDVLGSFDTTNNRYVVRSSGNFLVSANAYLDNTGAGDFFSTIRKNGSEVTACTASLVAGGFTTLTTQPCVIQAAANDYFEFFVSGVTDSSYTIQAGPAMSVTRFPTSSETVARLDAPGVLPTSYTPAIAGLGTVTNVDIRYQCIAPQKIMMRGRFQGGTPTATPAIIPLPAGFTIPTFTQGDTKAGDWDLSSTSNTAVKTGTIWQLSGGTSVAIRYNDKTSTANPFAAQNADSLFGSNPAIAFDAIIDVTASSPCPKSPQVLIPGSVYSSSPGVERVERATVVCSTSASITRQSGSWISSIGNISSSSCTLTLATGTFSDNPSCVASLNNTNTGITYGAQAQVLSSTSVKITGIYNSGASTVADSTGNFNLICMGPR